MNSCDSNPTHAPPTGRFKTTNNGDAVEIELCQDCLKHRIQAALDNQEGFYVERVVGDVLLRHIIPDSSQLYEKNRGGLPGGMTEMPRP